MKFSFLVKMSLCIAFLTTLHGAEDTANPSCTTTDTTATNTTSVSRIKKPLTAEDLTLVHTGQMEYTADEGYQPLLMPRYQHDIYKNWIKLYGIDSTKAIQLKEQGQNPYELVAFIKACHLDSLDEVKKSLAGQKVLSTFAGSVVVGFIEKQWKLTKECLQAIAATYPYAMYHYTCSLGKDNENKMDPIIEENFASWFEAGFMITRLRLLKANKTTHVSIGHYFILKMSPLAPFVTAHIQKVCKTEQKNSTSTTTTTNDAIIRNPYNYSDMEMLKKLFNLGLNPHHKAYCWLTVETEDIFSLVAKAIAPYNPERAEEIITQAHQCEEIDDDNKFNTKYMFHSGTRFCYAEVGKKDE
jgi:hypothetical protein